MRVVRDTAGKDLAELRVMDEYDAYYLDRRREAPLPVIYARDERRRSAPGTTSIRRPRASSATTAPATG